MHRKSQLAIEYGYHIREQSPETWVFWIHASDVARFHQSLQDAADTIKLRGRKDPKANIPRLFHDWLQDEHHTRKWVVILDNVDDAGFLLDSCSDNLLERAASRRRRLIDYLPYSQNGSLLITSRYKAEARKLVEESDIITVEPMREPDAIRLLGSKIGDVSDPEELPKLAATLEFMPLALVQAASYIQQRGLLCSIKRYIELFSHNDENKTNLLNHEGGHLRRDARAKNSIILAWQISFDHIRQTRPSAAELLSLMCFCNRQGIPAALLRRKDKVASQEESSAQHQRFAKFRTKRSQYYQAIKRKFVQRSTASLWHFTPDDDGAMSESVQDDEFDQDLLTLRDYAFVTVVDDTTFEMHDLVQLSTRTWLRAHGQYEKWNGQFVKNLCGKFPTEEHKNWPVSQQLYPHAKSSLLRPPKTDALILQWATTLHNAAQYLAYRGDLLEAEKVSLKVIETMKNVLKDDDEHILVIILLLSNIYRFQGRWKKAEKLVILVVEARKKALGYKARKTLTSMDNLALVYDSQGRWKEAEELHAKVLEERIKALGVEHEETLTSMNNMAMLHVDQGRWSEAEELHMKVLKIRQRSLRAEHPKTLFTILDLAQTYMFQERWKEAEELAVHVVKVLMRELGKEHPDTLVSMSNLAVTYSLQGRWEEAEKLGIQVLKLCKGELGEKHPNTLISMNNLAHTYKARGRKDKAVELMMEVVCLRKEILGRDHPHTKASISWLARWNS